MGLESFSDTDLRQELAKRQKAQDEAAWAEANARYGPCPTCGATLREIDAHVVEEHWEAPDWQGWPAPPPIDWHGRRRVGAEWETKLTCTNAHERYEREVRFDKVAAARET